MKDLLPLSLNFMEVRSEVYPDFIGSRTLRVNTI